MKNARTLGVLLSFFFIITLAALLSTTPVHAQVINIQPDFNNQSLGNALLYKTGPDSIYYRFVSGSSDGSFIAFVRSVDKSGVNGETGFTFSDNFETNFITRFLRVQFEIKIQRSSTASANPKDPSANFFIGSGFSRDNSTPPDDKLFAKLDLGVIGNSNLKLGGQNEPGYNLIQGQWYSVEIVLNDLYTNRSFDGKTIGGKSYQLWINGSLYKTFPKYTDNDNVTLNNFAFKFGIGDAEIRFRNARVLPVNLISFKAQPVGEKVELAWQTAWEKNSKEFVVQRSSDLKEFGDLATLPAAGDAQSRNTYAYTDHSPLPGTNYYRLRMVDLDGTYEYSKVIDAQLRPDQPLVLVSPNPATAQLIRLRAFNTDASSLRLTNILGQEVPFRTHSPGGEVLELLPLQPLTPGLYLLTLQQDGLRQHTKVLVR
jgi:hypothetical protein